MFEILPVELCLSIRIPAYQVRSRKIMGTSWSCMTEMPVKIVAPMTLFCF
jgi:hypothetical protein